MYENLKKLYGFSSWSKRGKGAVSVLFRNFTPWEQDCLGWHRRSRQHLQEPRDRLYSRTVWEDPKDPNSWVLIEVRETASSSEARKTLLEVLAHNELRLPEGPEGIGEVGFVHPDGVPPAIFWVTGNLCLSVVSFGANPVPVQEWGRRLHLRMVERPKLERPRLELTPERRRLKVQQPQSIRFKAPQLSDEGYYKFFSIGGELQQKDGRFYVQALQKGPVVLELFVLEPGQSPQAGRIELSAD